jgi:hypothetical protein
MTLSAIESAIFQLLIQCVNHYATACPQNCHDNTSRLSLFQFLSSFLRHSDIIWDKCNPFYMSWSRGFTEMVPFLFNSAILHACVPKSLSEIISATPSFGVYNSTVVSCWGTKFSRRSLFLSCFPTLTRLSVCQTCRVVWQLVWEPSHPPPEQQPGLSHTS